jgi:hypothetical protein
MSVTVFTTVHNTLLINVKLTQYLIKFFFCKICGERKYCVSPLFLNSIGVGFELPASQPGRLTPAE